MGAPRIVVPPAPVLPPLPDQASIAVQQFGAMFRRRAAAGYESTFPNQPDTSGSPLPFRTDTDPTPPAAPAPSPGTTVRETVERRLSGRRTAPTPAPGTTARETVGRLLHTAPTPAPTPPEQSRIVIDPATGLPTTVPVESPTSRGSRPPPEPVPDPEMALRDLIARRFSRITPR